MTTDPADPELAAGVSALPHQVARLKRLRSAVDRGVAMDPNIAILIQLPDLDEAKARSALTRLCGNQPFLSSEVRATEAAATIVPSEEPVELNVVRTAGQEDLPELARVPAARDSGGTVEIRTAATLMTAADRAVLRLDVNHLIADEWSVRCLAEQFMCGYRGDQPPSTDHGGFAAYLAQRHARIAAASQMAGYERLVRLLSEFGSPYGYVPFDPLVPMSARLAGGVARLRRQIDSAVFRLHAKSAEGSPLVYMLGRVAYHCAALAGSDQAMIYFYLANREDRRTDNISFWLASPSLLWLTGDEVKKLESCVEGAKRHVYRCLTEGDPVSEALHLAALRQGTDGFRYPSVWVTYSKKAARAGPNGPRANEYQLAGDDIPVSYGRGRIDIDLTDYGEIVDVSLTAEAGRFDLASMRRLLDLVSDFSHD